MLARAITGFAAVLMLAADPATMVRMGTRATGAPVVIIEAGAGNGAEAWSKVQPAIAEFARVCAYDRPGLRRHWVDGEMPAAPTPDGVIETLERCARDGRGAFAVCVDRTFLRRHDC
jgi:pimeloyl-ACP methyl ester carboxylesterase